MPALQRLRPGTRFRLAEMPEITGVLVKANECRAASAWTAQNGTSNSPTRKDKPGNSRAAVRT